MIKRTFDILEYAGRHHPRKDAICGKVNDEWIKYSTEQFAEYAELIAIGLISSGLKKGDKVATISGNRPEWSFADMGIAMAGGIHVPIYPTVSDDEYSYILKHSEVRYIFVSDESLYKRIKKIAEEMPAIEKIFTFNEINGASSISSLYQTGRENKDALKGLLNETMESIDEDDTVTLIYTSGTTGTPKGVLLSHNNIISNLLQHAHIHGQGIKHHALSFLPLSHILERAVSYHLLYKGMGIYYLENLSQIGQAMKEVKPHFFTAVPRVLERIYDGIIAKGKQLKGIKRRIFSWALRVGERFDYSKKYHFIYRLQLYIVDKLVFSKWREGLGGNIKVILSGGASLQPRICRLFGAAGIYTLEGYGLTEAAPIVALSNISTKEYKIGTTGPILPGVKVKFGDDGEILVKGPNIMKGYYKEPELTKKVIDEDGWFHTGDVGILEKGLYLKITDRKKEIFKLSGGKYIAPQMIENMFKESFLIEQVMVVGFNEKFASAIISPNFEYLKEWCSKQNIYFHNNLDIIMNSNVVALFRREIDKINKKLGQHEEIKRFRLVKDNWSPTTGELSHTLKLKRKYLYVKYKDIIDDIFAPTRIDFRAAKR